MSLLLAKKQEEANQKKVKSLLRSKDNKKCFDCQAKNPSFANITIQTFICARCSGLVREVGHRVKTVSTSKFSGAEVLALKKGGNGMAQKIWLSTFTGTITEPESEEHLRTFMKQKYLENQWLDNVLLQSHKEEVRKLISKSFTEDGLPIVTKSRNRFSFPGFSLVPLIADKEMNVMHGNSDSEEEEELEDAYHSYAYNDSPTSTTFSQTMNTPTSPITSSVCSQNRESMDSHCSTYSTPSLSEKSSTSTYSNKNSQEIPRDTLSSEMNCPSTITQQTENQVESSTLKQGTFINQALPSFDVNISPISSNDDKNLTGSILDLDKKNPSQDVMKSFSLIDLTNDIQALPSSTIPTLDNSLASFKVTRNALEDTVNDPFSTIISDLAGLKFEKTVRKAEYTGGMLSPLSIKKAPINQPKKDETSSCMFDADFFSKLNNNNNNKINKVENDPYAALRNISAPVRNIPVPVIKEDDKSSSEDEEDDWQEFCSSSSFENENDFDSPVQSTPVKPNKPVVMVNLFSDLDPLAMFNRH